MNAYIVHYKVMTFELLILIHDINSSGKKIEKMSSDSTTSNSFWSILGCFLFLFGAVVTGRLSLILTTSKEDIASSMVVVRALVLGVFTTARSPFFD